MIATYPFGRTGHISSRVVFGGAALFSIDQAVADRALERIFEAGVNHIDTAAGYGQSELRLAPFLKHRRKDVFLATKTAERTYKSAREGIHRSLERLGVDQVDLIQFHNLVNDSEWELALGDGGALQAAVEARDQGLVRFIGVTGHGTRVAKMHLRSIERFDFDSVLLPYNYAMMQDPEYASNFDKLYKECRVKNIAVQTIKGVARRRWAEGTAPTTTTWYEPLTAADAVERAVHWALGREGIFINSVSDLGVLEKVLAAAERYQKAPSEQDMQELERAFEVKPLFVHGYAAS